MISKVFEKVTDHPDENARTADPYPGKNWVHKDFHNSIHFNDTSCWEEAGSVINVVYKPPSPTVACVTNRLYAVIPSGTDRHSACYFNF